VTQVWSAAVHGVEAVLVRVEVNVASGLPGLAVVGLPQGAVREGRDRVQASLRAVGHALPPRRITVNLAPGDLKKEGSGFDLPMAVALLAACEVFPAARLEGHALVGELGLDGQLRPVRGVLPAARRCRAEGVATLVVPADNVAEAVAVGAPLRVLGAHHLRELVAHFIGEHELAPASPAHSQGSHSQRSHTQGSHGQGSHGQGSNSQGPRGRGPEGQGPPDAAQPAVDFREIRGQRMAKRALEIAAAGGHHVLIRGVPGGGKTLLARAMSGILPPLSRDEALEVTGIHSVAGLIPAGCGLLQRPPFRAPHHTVSTAGLVGGGRPPRPGEVSLAHRGVLFLDELGEFSRHALEALRQPLEDGVVSVVRVQERHTFPARFSLVAAMNPCPCGNLGSGGPPCVCDPTQVSRYRSRISGPLMDRIDLHVETVPVSLEALAGDPDGPSSRSLRRRVARAREAQARRFPHGTGGAVNARMGPRALREHVPLDAEAQRLLAPAVDRFGLSPRAIHRVLRVARTVADLEGSARVGPPHLAEALQFRIPSSVVGIDGIG
jgi:magnesium chelatase family protein